MDSPKIQRPIGFSPAEISARINEEVVEQHADNATFLWTQRDSAARAPNYSVKDLADLDERVEANLDGLRIAGQFGWELAEKGLGQEEPGEVFTAAVLAFESEDKERIHQVLEVGCSDLELQRALISALGWGSFEEMEPSIRELLRSDRWELRRVGIGACAVHRRDPGPPLEQAILDPETPLRARALRAAGELGKTDLLPKIRASIPDPDVDCRFWGVWSAARLGMRTAEVLAVLKQIAEAPGRHADGALDMGLRCMDLPQANAWRQELRNRPEGLRFASRATGIIGDPQFVDDLIALMEIQEVARSAGEAFSSITGSDLSYDDLDGDEPEGYEAGPNEDPEDQDVAMDADEDLPWPVPALVKSWWNEHRGEYRPGVRFLRGKEITEASLRETLIRGNQRQRAAAALELSLTNPTEPLFEVRAPGKRQLVSLSAWNL